MIKVRYTADRNWKTRNRKRRIKEGIFSLHCEKLAMEWAAMKTPLEITIRITMNLQLCGDYHTATKFISRIRNREILVRYSVRYHHFKDGEC